jgi:hypothetical protein
MPVNKREIVQHVLSLLPETQCISEAEAFKTWYQNIRESGGLRLSLVGYRTFQATGIQSWPVELADIKRYTTPPMLLELDRKMKYPYFIDYKNKRMIMFSSRDAMMATLYGDLAAWLKNQ